MKTDANSWCFTVMCREYVWRLYDWWHFHVVLPIPLSLE